MKSHPRVLWLACLTFSILLISCDDAPAQSAPGAPAAAPAVQPVKLSQFDKAGYAALVVLPDGTHHAVFTDRPAYDKPAYLYHRASTDGGRTWAEPKNISDDESGDDAGYVELLADNAGSVYAVWKYIGRGETLDGVGGYSGGRLTYRCLEGGKWSKRTRLGDDKIAVFSFFTARDAAGNVHVVWSQMTPQAAAVQMANNWYANYVRQAQLNGTQSDIKDVIVPEPFLTAEQQAEMKAQGKYPAYEDTMPKRTGLINLRGYIDAQGVARFVAEQIPLTGNESAHIVRYDGQQLTRLYAYEPYKTYNNFENPPGLLLDAAGREHLIRAPEKSETPCVRDYPIEDGELGDPTDIVAPDAASGALTRWQTHALPDGRMAVTAAISQAGGYSPDDLELYISFTAADGSWSAPVSLTQNAQRKTGFGKETTPGNTIGTVSTYLPRFADVTLNHEGKPAVLMVNSENTIVGTTSTGQTAAGLTVTFSGGGRVDNPMVFFLALP